MKDSDVVAVIFDGAQYCVDCCDKYLGGVEAAPGQKVLSGDVRTSEFVEYCSECGQEIEA